LGEGAAEIVPLITEAFNWQHGTFLGQRSAARRPAAITGKVGQLRRDPMREMRVLRLPHRRDYFAHWLQMGTHSSASKLPKIFLRQLVSPGQERQVSVAGLW